MKKSLIFLACLLCLTLCIVACENSDSKNPASSSSKNRGTEDLDWTDLSSGSNATTGGENSSIPTFEVDDDTSGKEYGPLLP